jgi:hypothetical protein
MIDVRLRVFIPSRAVSIPMGPLSVGFDGDNRTFGFDQGTSRAELWVDVDNSPFTTKPITVMRRSFGQSARYSMDKIQDVTGKPFWWKKVKRLPLLNVEISPDAIATAEVTEDTLTVHGTLEAGAFGIIPQVRVKFHIVGTNPLEALAPPINCDLDVLIAATGMPLPAYSVTGSHDGFPAYELYIAQRRVYSFDPVAAGTSPMNLALMGDQVVNIPTTIMTF